MDNALLEYYMRKKGVNNGDLCRELGISRSALYRKRNGISEFTMGEISAIVKFLGLESPMDVFFPSEVS